MKVILWWKLSSDKSYLVIKFSSDKSCLWIKVRIDKEVKRSDGLWRFACGDVSEEGSAGLFKTDKKKSFQLFLCWFPLIASFILLLTWLLCTLKLQWRSYSLKAGNDVKSLLKGDNIPESSFPLLLCWPNITTLSKSFICKNYPVYFMQYSNQAWQIICHRYHLQFVLL